LSLGAAEQVAREYGDNRDIRHQCKRGVAPPKGPGRALHTGSPEGRKGRPFLGAPLLSRPANHLNPILIFFVLGWVVVWGRGRRGASGRGALTVIPTPVVG